MWIRNFYRRIHAGLNPYTHTTCYKNYQGAQPEPIAQYAPWKDSRSLSVSKMEVAVLFCASVSLRRPNSSSLSLACEAASAASFAIPIRAYAYIKTMSRL